MSVPVRFRLGAGAALTGALVLVAPLAASAHVHVDPGTATAGAASADLVFTVPNESATATTTQVQVGLPASVAFDTVRPEALEGWTVRTLRSDDGGTRIRWTADGDGIGEGETVALPLTVGAIPDTGRLELPVRQTYSDGTVVHWDEATPASGAEPEHPVPTVYVNDTPPADHEEDAVETVQTSADDGSAEAALVLGGSALAVSAVAVVLAALALLRGRRRA